MADDYNGIPRKFFVDDLGKRKYEPVRRPHTLYDMQLDDEQFRLDYEDKPRRFNPLLWMTYKLRKLREEAIYKIQD